MRHGDFTPDVAKKVIDIWQEHMGLWNEQDLYVIHPDILSSDMQDPRCWVTGRFEARIGSRYTDDSKLIAYERGGVLELECYAQSHTVFRDNRPEVERAQEAFNLAVREYTNSLRIVSTTSVK